MSMTIAADPVPLRTDASGAVRVGQTRVLVDLVVDSFKAGATAEVIAEQYPSLQLADVYAVIAYYLRHRDEVDAYLQERQRQAEEMRRFWEARNEPGAAVRARLLARKQQQDDR